MKSCILTIETTEPIQIVNITDQVQKFILDSGKQNGFLLIESRHTTAGIRINESCKKLFKDLENFWARLAPSQADYLHNHEAIDGRANAHSHLLAFLMGSREFVTVSNAKINLGEWQNIFFIEFDGPRKKRQIYLTLFSMKD